MVLALAKKKALALEETPRIRTWDCEYDLYSHVLNKIRVLESENEKFNYFSTLLQVFVVKDPKADTELMQYMVSLSCIVQSLVLHLQDQNREDPAEDEEEGNSVVLDPYPENRYLSDLLKPHGKSYVFDIAEYGIFIKYEAESLSAPGSPDVCATDSANHVSNENFKGKLRVRKSKAAKLSAAKNRRVNESDMASKAHKHTGNCKGRRKGKRLKKHAVPVNMNGKGVSAACFAQSEGQTIGHSKKGKQTDTPSGMETRVKEEIEDYDDDDDDAPEIRRPVESPVLKVEHFWCDDEANASKLSEFREKLVNELERPYCQEEHKRLLQDFTVRKPVQHHKDLRGGIIIYEEDYLGKSFLDHHIDLAAKIDSARDDHPKVLNLLRGFFFWLKNLAHEGAFKPWRVPSCLDVLPQQ